MKYWNKDKDVRKRHWTYVKGVNKHHNRQDMKRWCQQQPSDGKFYFYYVSSNWWFEQEHDAIMFALRWS